MVGLLGVSVCLTVYGLVHVHTLPCSPSRPDLALFVLIQQADPLSPWPPILVIVRADCVSV